jgi:homoserine dehydrogenase
MNPVQIGLLGMGTVGGGTFDVLNRNQEEIQRRAGRGIQVAMIAVRNAKRIQPLVAGKNIQVVTDPFEIISNPKVDIVVELIGGCGIAKTLVMAALAAGKHVVTANKALVALHGTEIFALAREKGVMVAFEAAVAGGMPIIKMLREGLTANKIQSVAGIINGTTNFILSEMRLKGQDFSVALAQAQKLGYAESDPTFDIEGIDAAHKITIMSAIAFGVPVNFEHAYIEGISQLHTADIRYAEQLGYRVKLIGIARRRQDVGGIELRVHPTLIPKERLIASVEGVMNAVQVQADAAGTTVLCGRGAGAEPTASAVIADLVDVTRLHTAESQFHVPSLAFQLESLSNVPILRIDQTVTSFYLRFRVADQAGVLANITRVLADHQISIDAVLQREAVNLEQQTDVIILTHDTIEQSMDIALSILQKLNTVLSPIIKIRKEELN